MSLVDILAAAETGENTLTARVPDTWMQGRTAYGGLSAALALEAPAFVRDLLVVATKGGIDGNSR